MIKSKFILEILDLLLDGDNDGLMIRPQLDWLTDENYNYTGSGVFVTFSHDDNILTKRIQKDNLVLMAAKRLAVCVVGDYVETNLSAVTKLASERCL